MTIRDRGLAPLTSKPTDQGTSDPQATSDRASRVKMGRRSGRARDKLVSHIARCGASHMKDMIRLASRFVDERGKELCFAL